MKYGVDGMVTFWLMYTKGGVKRADFHSYHSANLWILNDPTNFIHQKCNFYVIIETNC